MANEVSDEDKKLFRSTVANLKIPNKEDSTGKPDVIPKPDISRKYGLSHTIFEEVGPETILSYCEPDIPANRFQELKSGKIKWEAKMDLHGVRFETAADTLCHLIEAYSDMNKRLILVIHGKGGRHGDLPLLKNYVNQWLRQLPQVIAFHSALPRDGGTGALYVLLRKNRK
ncbi:Smr domain protein, DNA mismatch repair protein-like protein (plasmid) [Legionella adelaidensis]|uniref:DNA mismatch repair protein-like protein n=1 Tax=Legionella adelaidensis TaxID=45056 RepID=A0A0W0R341_9GAMM|nr:Smr/MutS family protein [Legionella adelaidensis]KTC65449.1 DNA mismatch repair protein-like protein [Legionella adelaidensis]VEH84730.1 Smr domain protein, DNA mismatch repair protein-like protein [Legionella adelaidensis]